MKRRVFVLLLTACLVLGWSCTRQPSQSEPVQPMRFYYKTLVEDSGYVQDAVSYELREIAGHEEDYLWILTQYFDGPSSPDLTAPFQKSTNILSARLNGTQLMLNISRDLSELTGINLTLACACITLTCLELPNVESVQIRAEGGSLGGAPVLTMDRSSLLLEDVGAQVRGLSYCLYFSDLDNRYLIEESISVDREQDNLPAYLIERLIQGPSESSLAATMPLGTALLGLEISNGVCTVDLSAEFLDNAPRLDLAQRLTILSLTNTLTQLEEINSLILYTDGQLLSQYGAIDLSQPLTFEEGAVGPVRTSLNEFDANLYLTVGDSGLLSALPVAIRQTASESPAELVVQALLARADQNGYHNPIPAGTTLLSLSREGNCCIVDLSGEFLTAAKTGELELAVRSVAASVLALEDSVAVRITVDGTVPEGEYGGLFTPQNWDENWFAH